MLGRSDILWRGDARSRALAGGGAFVSGGSCGGHDGQTLVLVPQGVAGYFYSQIHDDFTELLFLRYATSGAAHFVERQLTHYLARLVVHDVDRAIHHHAAGFAGKQRAKQSIGNDSSADTAWIYFGNVGDSRIFDGVTCSDAIKPNAFLPEFCVEPSAETKVGFRPIFVPRLNIVVALGLQVFHPCHSGILTKDLGMCPVGLKIPYNPFVEHRCGAAQQCNLVALFGHCGCESGQGHDGERA